MNYPLFFKTLWYDIFIATFGMYLASMAIESVSRGLIASVVQLNTLLIVCAVSGLISLLFPPPQIQRRGIRDTVISIVVALIAGALTFQALRDETGFSILLAIAVSALLLFFAYSIGKINQK